MFSFFIILFIFHVYFIFIFSLILQALQNFFAALVYSANTSFDVLLDSLLSTAKPSPSSGGVAKQALFSIAQCVAVLCLAAGDQKCSSTVNMLTEILKDDSSTNSVILYDCFSQSFIIFDYTFRFYSGMASAKVLFAPLLDVILSFICICVSLGSLETVNGVEADGFGSMKSKELGFIWFYCFR